MEQDTQPALFAAPPPARPARLYKRSTVYLVLALTILILALWLLGTPPGIGGKADAIGYAICHQIDERSFHAHGEALPLCARCTGIYIGVMTGLFVLILAGRGKASNFPPLRVLLILGLFVVIVGLDGVNSYLHLFPGYTGPYAPNNTLRLITGSLVGLTLINIIFPVFNYTVWAKPDPQSTLHHLGDIAGLVMVIGLIDVLILLRNPYILTFFGLLSAIGPALVLTMVFTILFISFMRRENTVRTYKGLALPLVFGVGIAFLMLGGIDLLRFQLTGTWDGFDFSQFTK